MTEGLWDGKKKLFGRLGLEDPPGLVRLMRRMLVLDPAKRPSAQELLDDPYFSCSNGASNVVQLPTGISRSEEAVPIQFGTVDFRWIL
jgi:serine/threonine protein kinase